MLNVWEKSKIDLYFEDEEQERLVRQGFGHLVKDATEEEVTMFIQMIHSLHEIPVIHAIVTDSHRYIV